MITLILISTAIFFIILGIGVAIWFTLHTRRLAQSGKPASKTINTERLPFRWNCIILPLATLLIAIVLAAYFYGQLPTEVAYHFKPDGSPDKWLSREMIMVWLLTPQLCLTLLAGAIVWGATKLGIQSRQTKDSLRPEGILALMGNIIGLPQLIIGFTMLDIFSYNAYRTHIMPIWIFVLIVMGLASIILGIFFIQAIRRAWGASQ
jgi:uncharacterized membrane protein